ncbi:MAG: zinc-ribbon domain-containing protein [Deltaproteobacteria bacterium]|nr:zinc-ribbon domain-containing protein [Deltaproteobacteria bacterium]
MEITCQNCNTRLKIPDDKIPPDRPVSLTCPKCQGKISIQPKPRPEAEEPSFSLDYVKDLDFFEEGAKPALVCVLHPPTRDKVVTALEELGYKVSRAKDPLDAANKVRFTQYEVVLTDETFPSASMEDNPVLDYLVDLPMAIRRKIVVIVLVDKYRTFDNMAAFIKSVNALINNKDSQNFKPIIEKIIADNIRFYKVYRECLRELGKN